MTTKNIFTFLGTFVVGALLALVARAALFNPHEGTSTAPAAAAVASADPHAGHVAAAAAPKAKAKAKPVNTVCAICGMDVDPSLPTAEYKGQTIGFGCAACPPKFAKNPDRWGPAALKNQVVD